MDFKQHMKQLESEGFETVPTTNGRITIKQGQRNALRRSLITEFADFLRDQGIEAELTQTGIIMPVYNDGLEREVCIELKMSIKGLDYNLDEEVAKFEAKAQMTEGE